MKVFVTGAAGFIGSVVTQRLIEEGYDVLGFDNLSKGHHVAVEPKAKFVEGDIRDSDLVNKTISDFRPDAVMHLAAEALIDESVKNPGLFFETNHHGGVVILEA